MMALLMPILGHAETDEERTKKASGDF